MWPLEQGFPNCVLRSLAGCAEKFWKNNKEESKKTKKKENPDIVTFWLTLTNEYPAITKKAMNVQLPFSSPYICESAFMNLIIKKKHLNFKHCNMICECVSPLFDHGARSNEQTIPRIALKFESRKITKPTFMDQTLIL